MPELLLVTCILLHLPQGQELGAAGPLALQYMWLWWELGSRYTAEGFLEIQPA